MIQEILKFTPREKEVILLFVIGLSYKLIAVELDISLDTVKTFARNIRGKLNVNSTPQVVFWANNHDLNDY
jgi:DNA-binding CsgD family transcriptional regulator